MPLVHDTALLQFEMPPFVCLRVRGIASQVQPARNGPILAHCGGPLTGRECAQDMSEVSFLDIDGQHEIISHFDLISIDQRGVLSTQDTYERQGKWGVPPPCPFEESGQALKPFPEVYCDEAAKHNLGSVKQVLEQLVTVGHNQSMEELARTYVLPIYLNRGIPVSVLTEGNESFVRWYYRLVRLEHSLCFEAPRYKIQAPNGRMYNTLQFAGTIDLAYDIEAWEKKCTFPFFSPSLLLVSSPHPAPPVTCHPYPPTSGPTATGHRCREDVIVRSLLWHISGRGLCHRLPAAHPSGGHGWCLAPSP